MIAIFATISSCEKIAGKMPFQGSRISVSVFSFFKLQEVGRWGEMSGPMKSGIAQSTAIF